MIMYSALTGKTYKVTKYKKIGNGKYLAYEKEEIKQ